jgi:hypothetical protein
MLALQAKQITDAMVPHLPHPSLLVKTGLQGYASPPPARRGWRNATVSTIVAGIIEGASNRKRGHHGF